MEEEQDTGLGDGDAEARGSWDRWCGRRGTGPA